jgi:hypothetical protein
VVTVYLVFLNGHLCSPVFLTREAAEISVEMTLPQFTYPRDRYEIREIEVESFPELLDIPDLRATMVEG